MQIEQSNILLIGLLLVSGLFAGQLAGRFGIPRVAAYVLIGVLYSAESLGSFIKATSEDWSLPITQSALAIIAFIIGGSITSAQLMRMGKSMIGIALGESFGAAIAVFFRAFIFSAIGRQYSAVNSRTGIRYDFHNDRSRRNDRGFTSIPGERATQYYITGSCRFG